MISLAELSDLHRDPFDRIILAQAIQHGMTIATVDKAMLAYPTAQFLSR